MISVDKLRRKMQISLQLLLFQAVEGREMAPLGARREGPELYLLMRNPDFSFRSLGFGYLSLSEIFLEISNFHKHSPSG